MTQDNTTTRSFKFRIDPKALSSSQTTFLEQCAGTARAFWNWGLALWNEQEKAVRAEFSLRTQDMSDEEKSKASKDKSLWKDIRSEVKTLEIDGEFHQVTWQNLDKAFSRHPRDPDHRLHWWVSEKHGIPARVPKESIRILGSAVSDYMSGKNLRGKTNKPRKDGMPSGWPSFKSKFDGKDGFVRSALNFDTPKNKTIIESARRIYIHSIGSLRVGGSTKALRDCVASGGTIKTARFTKRGGYWYVSLSVTVPESNTKTPSQSDINRLQNNGPVGVDLGVKTFAALSNTQTIENPRSYQKNKDRVNSIRRELSRKTKGSNSRKVVAKKLSKTLHRIDLQKKTWLNIISKDLTTRFETIVVENLNVSGMTSTPKPKEDPNKPGHFLPNGASAKSGLNREILDVSFYEFRRQLEYKSQWYGSNVVLVDRFFPSSKTCSSCGWINKDLTLSDRMFICDCGLNMDRDLNASKNILAYHLTPAKNLL